jgi:Carboxypeptidase regulatory-like domain/TonB dependent receptor
VHFRIWLAGFALALTTLAPCSLYSQAVGSIIGVVTDSSRAVVANATVTAVQKGTNFSRTTTSTLTGNFSLPLMPVGAYLVTAEAPGFEKSSLTVSLDVDQSQEVDFTLNVAGVQTKVNVEAVAPTINTTSGEIGGVVQGRQVSNLPLNGRDITNLMLMLPGQTPENNSSFQFEINTSGNGNRGTTGSSYLDGMDASDNELGGGQFGNFNLDAISEFRVLQNNYSAEYGRGSGTIVSIVSKTGTNEFHGSAFEFLRNDKLNARNFFAPNVAPFRRNEFGVTFGGPIWLPKIYTGKNKTFFFFEYAGFRQRLATPVVISVPTAAERQGIVSITPTSAAPYTLQVPVTADASAILNKYPLPNNPNGAFGPNTLQTAYSVPINRDQYSGRLDQRFSDRDSFFFRYSVASNHAPVQDAAAALINPSFPQALRNDWINSGLSETHLFGPSLINEVRISGMQSIEQLVTPPSNITQVSFADGALNNYGPDGGGGGFSLAPFTMSYRDAITWVKGKHTMNFGGEYRPVHSSYFGTSIGGPNGVYTFAAGSPLPVAIPSSDGLHNLSAGDPSPSSIVSFMTGISQFYERSVAYPGFGPPGGGFAPFSMRRFVWSGWFQDDWKITRDLTFNLGLRYEYNSVPYETGDRLAGIVNDPNFLPDKSLFGRMVLNPSPIYREDYKGFAPRFGMAWKITPKTVLRGGFAIFTNLPLSQTADQQGFNFPFSGYSTAPNLLFTTTPRPLSLPPIKDLAGNVVPANGNSKTVPKNDPIDLTPYAPLLTNLTSNDLHNGYTISGNVTVERELPWNTVLQAGYVFNNAVSLYASQYPNAYAGAPLSIAPYTVINPGLSEFQLTDNHGHSTYNSLQVVFRKSAPTAGLTFQLSYTYAKAIDNATTVYNGGDSANSSVAQNNPLCWSCEKAPSSFDVRHRVVVNFSYALPFDKIVAAPKRLTQGWTLWGITTASRGFPFTVLTPFGSAEYGIDTYAGSTVRPDLVKTPTYKAGNQGPEEQLFSNAVLQDSANFAAAVNNNQSFAGQFFAVPLTSLNGSTVAAHPGDLGRNTFRGAGFSNLDLSLAKDTKLFERLSMQFRAEFFNIFNQHVFATPGLTPQSGAGVSSNMRTLGSPGFGVSTATLFDPREIQLGLRLIF